MKVLMLTPYLPYPLLSGGQIRTYNLLKNLKDKHQITLFSFIRNEDEKKYLPNLQKFCHRIEVFKRRPAWSFANILLCGFSPFPFLVAIYYSWSLRKAIARELEKENYDLIHAETFYVMPNIPRTKVPRLLVEQTIEYLVYQHFVENFPHKVLKPLLYFDVAKIKFWEKHYWQAADRVIAMSSVDKNKMKRLSPKLKVDIVPNGVDMESFKTIKHRNHKQSTILFVGNFRWLQNREAAERLIKEIWPLIKEKMKNVRLWIVGKNPGWEIKKLAAEDIKIEEELEDIRQAYQKADVLLAPLFGAGGTRFKILEAMAASVPVVTTSVGIEGLGAVNEKQALIRNSISDLAEATVMVVKNKNLANKLTKTAKKLVEEKYNWQSIAQKLDKVYEYA